MRYYKTLFEYDSSKASMKSISMPSLSAIHIVYKLRIRKLIKKEKYKIINQSLFQTVLRKGMNYKVLYITF